MRNITMKAIQKASSRERVTFWELSVFICCFYLCSFKVLLFTSSTARLFLEAANLNSSSFFSRPLGTFSRPKLLSFVPATVILWAVKNSFTWHAPTEPGMCDGSIFGKKEWKKTEVKRKKPHSQQCWDSAKKDSSSSCVSLCPGEGKSIEAKVWLYRQESPAIDTTLSQVPWRQTDIAVALFITSYNWQTTLTLLQWAQKQAK